MAVTEHLDPTLDRERLTRVRELIVADPGGHRQRSWATRSACGTSRCVAGWTVHDAGDELVWYPIGLADADADRDETAEECVTPDGLTYTIAERAQDLLGLTDDEAEALFFCSDEEVNDVIDQILGGEFRHAEDVAR